MKYRVTHKTKYSGDQPVSVCHNEACLKPRETPYQHIDAHQLSSAPQPTSQAQRQDYFQNNVWAFSFSSGYDEMTVASICDVTLSERMIPPLSQSPAWEQVVSRLCNPMSEADRAACEFTFESSRCVGNAELTEYARQSFPSGRPVLEALAELTSRIFHDFKYDPRATTVTTRVEDAFRMRKGVCQDFAHVQIAALRSLGLAARYVSGYLRTRPVPGKPRLIGADASHAWLSVYVGDGDWFDLDPTNNVFPSLEHITVAWGRDYGDVCPLKGVFIGGGRLKLDVSVDVAQIAADGSLV